MDNLLWRNGFPYRSWKFSHHRSTSKEKVSHFLLTSLVFPDRLVGFVTMLYLIEINVSHHWVTLLIAWNTLDMFAGLSSIFHLAVISLERLHATLRPFRHRQLSLKAYCVAIATPWFLSLSLTIST